MNKVQAVVYLSQLNRISKIVTSWMLLSQSIDMGLVRDVFRAVQKNQVDVVIYLQGHITENLAKLTETISPMSELQAFLLAKKKKNSISSNERIMLSEIYNAVSALKEYVKIWRNQQISTKYKMLIKPFANEVALEAFNRAVKAGFLLPDYKLAPSLTRTQRKVLAFAIGQLLVIPTRKRYVYFEQQWECDRIGCIYLPECFQDEIDVVRNAFPEVDYSSLLNSNPGFCFSVPYSTERIKELFNMLMEQHYIDSNTKYSAFKRIFSLGNQANFEPVEWKKNLRSLSYFVYNVLAPTNKDYWTKAQYCFTVNGKTPNRGTLRSGYGIIMSGIGDEFDKTVLNMAKLFNRDLQTIRNANNT